MSISIIKLRRILILGALLSLGADKASVLRSVATVSTPYESSEPREIARTLQEILEIISAADASEKAREIAKQVFYRIQTDSVQNMLAVYFHDVDPWMS